MGLGGLGFYVTVWVVMMAAMMFPSVAPTVLMYDRLREGHRARGKGAAADATALFVAGYLLVWTAAGLAAYALFELVRAFDPAFLAWDEAGRYVAGGVIVVAAVYQVTPLKQACLVKCRSPMMFLAERWRHGRAGASGAGDAARRLVPRLLLGADGGAVCRRRDEPRLDGADRGASSPARSCCPGRPRPGRAVAVLLLVLGLGVAFAPADVPGFAEPNGGMHGGPGGAEPMEMMR